MGSNAFRATLIGLGATVAFGATTASAAVVTTSFAINSATIADLYSATFDGGLVPCGGSPTPECTFFGGNTPAGRAISISATGTGDGTLNVDWESTTGEILAVNSMVINLPSMTLVIAGSTTVTVTRGGGPAVNDPFIEAGTGTLGRDLDGAGAGVALGQGTADADEGSGIGDASIFRHDDAPNPDAPDFAVFNEIVDGCTGGLCGLIGVLSLDGVRYQLGGVVNALGGDALVLKAQTGNNSIYTLNMTTAAVPVPAAAWLMIPAVGAIAARARRRRA
ncbi:MAG: hypothetical protein IT486_12975 [Gammaproteobacteria bacterium]|nr:hypothetical protein [Gammaproteobacteria bacterium]